MTSFSETHNSRVNLRSLFEHLDFCDIFTERQNFENYMEKINQYKFVLSPRGNGIDTHRFWEILTMGSIPIVESSGLDSLYYKFPCIIVQSFKEVNKKLLDSYQHDSGKKENIERYLFIKNIKSIINTGIKSKLFSIF